VWKVVSDELETGWGERGSVCPTNEDMCMNVWRSIVAGKNLSLV